jgi:protocatechuate 3,4-dioxygenase beta subunit
MPTILKEEKLGDKPFFSRLEIVPGEEVTGVIEDPDGRPVADVPVEYRSDSPSPNPRQTCPTDWATEVIRTDPQGRFRFNAIKGSKKTGISVRPAEYAAFHREIGGQRGDLGAIRLETGIRLNGKVVDVTGKPVPDVQVDAWAGEVGREARTDAQGRFRFGPFQAGRCTLRVAVAPYSGMEGRDAASPPAVFLPMNVNLSVQEPPEPVEFRAVPHVTVRVQNVDGAGKPTPGREVALIGKLEKGGDYQIKGVPDEHGRIVALMPKGAYVTMLIFGDANRVKRFRQGKDGPLSDDTQPRLGTLDEDVDDLFVVYYKAPVVAVRVLGADGRAVKDCRVNVRYPQPEVQGGRAPLRDSVNFEQQEDGRWRSRGILPDQEFTLEVESKGIGRTHRHSSFPKVRFEKWRCGW